MTIRSTLFLLAIPFCLYASFFGIVDMGLCTGLRCLPYTWAWILAAPCLLFRIWSLRATAVALALLLVIHAAIEIAQEGFSLSTLWGNDKGVDLALWVGVLLVVVAALIPPTVSESAKASTDDTP